MDTSILPIDGKGGLIEILRTIKDPRHRRGRRHSSTPILAVATSAMLSGARGFSGIDQWGKGLSKKQLQKLRCETPPSVSTYKRVLQRIDPIDFDEKISNWLISVSGKTTGRGIAVDGKTLRGTLDKDKKQIHLLSALLHQEKLVITQKKIPDKTNEISEFKNLLKPIDLTGMMVTADAMHCQTGHSEFLVKEKNADFLFVVRENQPSLYMLLQAAFINSNLEVISSAALSTKGHGRIDNHEAIVKTWSVELAKLHAFPFITQICKITRTWTDLNGANSKSEEKLCITSASTAAADELLRCSIDHWAIENSSHYVRDETLGEDRSRIRKGNAPQIMASIRNLSIGIIRLSGGENIAEGIRHFQWANKSKALKAIGI